MANVGAARAMAAAASARYGELADVYDGIAKCTFKTWFAAMTGKINWHRNVPSSPNTWTRLLPPSPTNTSPKADTAMPLGC